MLTDLPLLDRASLMARHAAFRHALIAGNVANADTPGYRARDAVPYAQAADRAAVAPRATRPGHAGQSHAGPGQAGPGQAGFRAVTPDLPALPNGNTVVIEDQMFRAAEAESQHRLALAVYSKSLDLLRLGLGRRR